MSPRPESHETAAAASGEGTVVLDIGDDTGALVVYMPAVMEGVEVELRPVSGDGPQVHTAVRPRHVGGRTSYAAVYPALVAGDYLLLDAGDRPHQSVSVYGGRVTEADWL